MVSQLEHAEHASGDDAALEAVREAGALMRARRAGFQDAGEAFKKAVVDAVSHGVPPSLVARAGKVTPQRITAIAGKAPRRPARKKAGRGSRAGELDTLTPVPPATLAPDAPLLSGYVTERHRQRYGAPTAFFDLATGRLTTEDASQIGDYPPTVAGVLQACSVLPHYRRVFLVGPAPRDEAGATAAEQVRAWALGPVPAGWSAGAHYLADPDMPVLRFSHADGHEVRIMRAAAWLGETDADVTTVLEAWRGLEAEVRAAFTLPPGFGLADTPSTAGRALWLRTVHADGIPVMSEEVRQLITATSGQGRIELFDAPRRGIETADDFALWDGRLMYAGLLWGMPVGEPMRLSGAEVEGLRVGGRWEGVIRGRSRWLVTATVPAGWEHIGLLPLMVEGSKRWVYPRRPGTTFTTWVDGCEAWLALEHGWQLEFHDGLSWAEGKPLERWARLLVGTTRQPGLWHRLERLEGNAPAAGLAKKAVRQMIVATIGAFASSAHPVTKSAPADEPPDVPAGTEVRRVGDALVWEEPGKLSGWSAMTAHPEWSATIWARARVRLAQVALTMPPDRIVAMSTDALYVAGGPGQGLEPGAWRDNGEVGTFRLKGVKPAPWQWPATWGELFALRDAAEAAVR